MFRQYLAHGHVRVRVGVGARLRHCSFVNSALGKWEEVARSKVRRGFREKVYYVYLNCKRDGRTALDGVNSMKRKMCPRWRLTHSELRVADRRHYPFNFEFSNVSNCWCCQFITLFIWHHLRLTDGTNSSFCVGMCSCAVTISATNELNKLNRCSDSVKKVPQMEHFVPYSGHRGLQAFRPE